MLCIHLDCFSWLVNEFEVFLLIVKDENKEILCWTMVIRSDKEFKASNRRSKESGNVEVILFDEITPSHFNPLLISPNDPILI
jgi:hypothetical protein